MGDVRLKLCWLDSLKAPPADLNLDLEASAIFSLAALSPFVYLFVCLPIFVSIYLSLYPSVYLPIYLSVYLQIYLTTCPSLHLSTSLSLCHFVSRKAFALNAAEGKIPLVPFRPNTL